MSCRVNLTGSIQDVSAIRRCLFPTDDQRGTDCWLQRCEVSISPVGDLIVIGNERKIVVLATKWNPEVSLNLFEVIHSGSIHDYDKVKSVLCLPIVSHDGNSSSAASPDWTCILVAFDSGYVRFYTEKCELLMEERFHNENITKVKCQSQHNPRPDVSPDLRPEEIYVQYQSVLCILNGPQICSHLRSCRNSLYFKEKHSELLQPQLTPKKWGFEDQSIINDCVVVGLDLSNNTFDHLLTASICGGFETKYRAMPPHNSLVIGAGSKPFLGFHYALEGVSQPALSDIAKAVTKKLRSALPGWLTRGNSLQDKHLTLAMQPEETMGCRFGSFDLRRTATDIILSPDRRLAACSDLLGRVLLIDATKGIILRVFKGYREAQCSFVQVPDEKKSSKHRMGDRITLFLVIYSSKKGTLEIFSLQQGNKVASFNAARHSRLLYISYGLMGFLKYSKSKYICPFTTVLIDNDGQVKEISVPFHFALPEKNSRLAKDVHLYKKLKHLLKSGEFDEEKLLNEAYSTVTELETVEIKSQTVDLLIGHKSVPVRVSLQCVDYLSKNLPPEEDGNNLRQLCSNVTSLLEVYLFATDFETVKENGNVVPSRSVPYGLGGKEMKNLQKCLDLSTMNDNVKLPKVHVSFSDNVEISPSEFLSTFNLATLLLKLDVDGGILFRTAEVLFEPYIMGSRNDFDRLQAKISIIDTRNLFHLLFNYWVNRSLHIDLNLEKEMGNLSLLIHTLVKTANAEVVNAEYNEVSTFWSDIRDFLANSSRPFPALIAAILCKSVACKMETDVDPVDDTMEVLSQENVEWSLLIGKLEDVSLLNIVLSTRIDAGAAALLPKLEHDGLDVSLRNVLRRGRGSVSELVARWLTAGGVSQDVVLDRSDGEERVSGQLQLLRQQFPYSLEGGALLANMAWEYAQAWQRDIQDLEKLEAAVGCLEAVRDSQIRQGLYQLMWNTHLKIVNESTCKVLNKVGRLPKERLCRQGTGLSDRQISRFITISTDFLSGFLDTVGECANIPKPVLQFENIWFNGSPALIEVAVQQRDVNYELLHLHYQLSLVLQMITTFSIKYAKPVNNLFEPSTASFFFADLQRRVEINWNKSDVKLHSSRTKFLFKIISASLESVSVDETGKIYSSEHVRWMSRCVTLGRFWSVDVDVLRRRQVVLLYSNGFDAMAEELVAAVNDTKALGAELLSVAVRRMSHFLSTSPDLSENITAISPVLSGYLRPTDEEWCLLTPLKDIEGLTIQTLRCLTEDQPEYKPTQLLLEACRTLEENHPS